MHEVSYPLIFQLFEIYSNFWQLTYLAKIIMALINFHINFVTARADNIAHCLNLSYQRINSNKIPLINIFSSSIFMK